MRSPAILASLALVACGAPAPAVRAPGPERPPSRRAEGVELLSVLRPGAPRTRLSLFVDAGARDATPSGIATVAAWSVAEDAMEARTLSDWLELSVECAPESLDRCVASLGRALATREVSEPALTTALARLRQSRRRAAADPRRQSDRLALIGLLGEGADPLGTSADREITATDVNGFLADHFGPSRAFLVAVGPNEGRALQAAAERAFGGAPTARRIRAERPAPETGVRVEVDGTNLVSVATTFRGVAGAIATGRRWLGRRGETASADVFPLRGTTALVMRAPGEPEEIVLEAHQLLGEHPRDGVRPPLDSTGATARWHGARWASGPGEFEGGLGVGVLVRGGRADRTDDAPTEDEELRREARAAVARALQEPTLGRTMDDRRVRLVLENGVAISGTRLADTEQFSVAIRFAGGAQEETPRLHGTTGLLVHALARSCIEAAPDSLGAPADVLGVEVRVDVRPNRFGWTVTGPRERWPEITYLASRCARLTEWPPGLLERARHSLPASDAPLSALATAISADAPGRITPWPNERVNGSPDDLRRWARRTIVGRRMRIRFGGEVPAGPVARRLAQFTSRLPAGEVAEPRRWLGPPATLAGQPSTFPGVWIVFHGESGELRRLANRYLDAVANVPGIEIDRRQRGSLGARTYLAVLARADESALAQLPERLSGIPSSAEVAGPSFVVLRPQR